MDRETIHGRADFDLAGQARIRLPFGSHAQHLSFFTIDGWDRMRPRAIDDDMAGSASTDAATVAIDAGHTIARGDVHQRLTIGECGFG